jgi:hypothetical protein
MDGETRVSLLSWIAYMCREFFFGDVEQTEASE